MSATAARIAVVGHAASDRGVASELHDRAGQDEQVIDALPLCIRAHVHVFSACDVMMLARLRTSLRPHVL